MILYEYPFNERVRTCLRLEHLLDRLHALVAREDAIDHQFAIYTLFELLEVTSRIDGNIVSRGTAIVRAPKSAFVYPGQGIQKQGMVLDERAKSPAAREVWERADKVTREKLGFSILAVVRDNPKELTAARRGCSGWRTQGCGSGHNTKGLAGSRKTGRGWRTPTCGGNTR